MNNSLYIAENSRKSLEDYNIENNLIVKKTI